MDYCGSGKNFVKIAQFNCAELFDYDNFGNLDIVACM